MSEIDRVKSAIAAFFRSTDIDRPAELAAVIERCAARARRRLDEGPGARRHEVEGWLRRIEDALNDLQRAPPPTKTALIQRYQEVTELAMTALRATYPTEQGYSSTEVLSTLMDDRDAYAFAIFDTVAEDIGALLPSLYRLAVEGAWDDEITDDE